MSQPSNTPLITQEPLAVEAPVRSATGRRHRLFYASGPGDNIGTYRHWKQHQDDPGEPVVPYSGQFYDLCNELEADAYVLSTCPRRDRLRDGRLRIEHRPYAGRSARGVLFHLAQLWYGLRLAGSALRFRPDVAVINEGAHWFLLTILDWAGIRVVPSLHVRLDWQGRTRLAWRIINRLNRRFFRRHCTAVLVASRQIAEDVEQLTGAADLPVIEFLPLYRRSTFEGTPLADHSRRPFNVLFVGRVEANKGVFDLLEAARIVWRQERDVHFHVCGTGSALVELQARVDAADLADRFHLHGHRNRAQLPSMYEMAHVVIVPTRSEFGEGFNQVTSEGVLTARPVITSAVCPAVAYVWDAVVEVPVNDVRAYADAIVKLARDREFYVRKQQACLAAQDQFYDVSRSWRSAVRRVLEETR